MSLESLGTGDLKADLDLKAGLDLVLAKENPGSWLLYPSSVIRVNVSVTRSQ